MRAFLVLITVVLALALGVVATQWVTPALDPYLVIGFGATVWVMSHVLERMAGGDLWDSAHRIRIAGCEKSVLTTCRHDRSTRRNTRRRTKARRNRESATSIPLWPTWRGRPHDRRPIARVAGQRQVFLREVSGRGGL